MRWIAATAVAVLMGTSADAATIRLDFDTQGLDAPGDRPAIFGTGVPITDVITGADRGFFDDASGVTFSSPDGPLVLFNSDCGNGGGQAACSGGDPDLGTGPAFGSDPQGNILIVMENPGTAARANTTDPNAAFTNPDDAVGNTSNPLNIIMTFEQSFFPNGGTIENVVLIDQDGTESVQFFGRRGTQVFDLFETSVVALNVPTATATCGQAEEQPNGEFLCVEDNSVFQFNFTENNTRLDGFEVRFSGSGGIEFLEFSPSVVVPLPPAALLLMAGLGGLAIAGRKRTAEA